MWRALHCDALYAGRVQALPDPTCNVLVRGLGHKIVQDSISQLADTMVHLPLQHCNLATGVGRKVRGDRRESGRHEAMTMHCSATVALRKHIHTPGRFEAAAGRC